METETEMLEQICELCGHPLRLYLTEYPGINDVLKAKIVPSVVHDHCYDQRWHKMQERNEGRLAEIRSQSWAGICPPLYQATDFYKIPFSAGRDKVFEWEFNSKGVGAIGRTGRGKTRTAYCTLKKQHQAGKSIVAMTHTEFTERSLRLVFGTNHDAQARWVKLLTNCDILFIDDLGKSRFVDAKGDAKYAEEFLWDVIERRLTKLLPLFFTSQFTGEELELRMSPDKGPALMRRLREMTEIVMFN